MAIIGPGQLPSVLKVDSNPLKLHALSQLGHPVSNVELVEPQMEQILRSAGNFITQYFPLEERYAFFNTTPLQSEYDLPDDAYFVREVFWDSTSTRIDDIFSAESFLFNIGNVTGIQNLLTDYHLLQSYRKFSQRVLGTEGTWEFGFNADTIRLYPVPKSTFPVVVRYIPSVEEFKSPSAKKVTYDHFLGNMKVALGHARRKVGNMPSPDGGSYSLDGNELIAEGQAMIEKAESDAILLGEPLGIYVR